MRRGFTLGEVVVAVAVLAIAVLALVTVQAYALRATVANREQLMASEIAGSVMAGLQAQFSGEFPSVALPRTPVAGRDGFEYEVIEAFEDPPDNVLKRVTVKVYYKDRSGDHVYTLWTFFHDNTT